MEYDNGIGPSKMSEHRELNISKRNKSMEKPSIRIFLSAWEPVDLLNASRDNGKDDVDATYPRTMEKILLELLNAQEKKRKRT